MKGVSSIIAIILLLMITISLTGLGYITFTSFFSKMTNTTEGAMSNTLTKMLAQMRIEGITNTSDNSVTMVYIRNNGKTDLTNFSAYVNDALASKQAGTPPGDKIVAGSIGNLNITGTVNSGSVIKITTAQSAIAIQTKP